MSAETFAYIVTATGANGSILPDAVVTISDTLRPGIDVTCWDCLGWWRQQRCVTCHPLAFPGPLCIDGREYHHRQQARRRRGR